MSKITPIGPVNKSGDKPYAFKPPKRKPKKDKQDASISFQELLDREIEKR